MKVFTTKDEIYQRVTMNDPNSMIKAVCLKIRKYRFLGIRFWSRCVASEDMPDWAYIQQATTGHTDWNPTIRGD